MLDLSCLCGRVRIALASRPDYVNACNCTLCAKTGARWGYFNPGDVIVSGTTQAYRREDKADPTVEIGFCGRCGATTHFRLTQSAAARFGDTMMGVNMALADECDLAGIELRFPDGKTWAGDGPFGHVRAARIIGDPAGSA